MIRKKSLPECMRPFVLNLNLPRTSTFVPRSAHNHGRSRRHRARCRAHRTDAAVRCRLEQGRSHRPGPGERATGEEQYAPFVYCRLLSESRRCLADDTQTALGNTELPAVLAAIVKDVLRGLRVPDVSHLPALYEVLRVGANVCVDHGAASIVPTLCIQ